MLQNYRIEKNICTSNAILFTTESRYRKDTFLFKKCANHIKEWISGKKNILILGNLNSYRNINHASDVSKALLLISKQEKGDDYLVCSEYYFQVKKLIIILYKIGGIELIENTKENKFYCNNEIIIEFAKYNRTFEANLNGNCKKLKNIGWEPDYNIEKLFKDLIK